MLPKQIVMGAWERVITEVDLDIGNGRGDCVAIPQQATVSSAFQMNLAVSHSKAIPASFSLLPLMELCFALVSHPSLPATEESVGRAGHGHGK